MSGRVLGGDFLTKQRVLWHEEPDGQVVIETQQEYEDILVENQENRHARSGFKGGPFHHVAQIPEVVLRKAGLYRKTKSGEWELAPGPDILKWLETEEGKVWKTHAGRLA